MFQFALILIVLVVGPCKAACPAGQYQYTTNGGSSCTNCNSGQYSSTYDQTFCVNCNSGTYSGTGQSSCTGCGAGKFATIGATSTSVTDAEGRLYKTQGASSAATQCTPCPAGYSQDSADYNCYACAPGRYSVSGASVCSLCDPGYFSEGTSGSSLTAISACTLCQTGQFNQEVGLSFCEDCQAGKYNLANSTDCLNCAPGSNSAAGAAKCSVCSPGTFNNEAGLSYCMDCPTGAYSEENATACNLCDSGFFFSLDTEACDACPVGTECVVSNGTGSSTTTNLPIAPGYWRISSATSMVRSCPNPDWCDGGRDFGRQGAYYCREGHTSPLCSTCRKFTHLMDATTGLCVECETNMTRTEAVAALSTSPAALTIYAIAALLMLGPLLVATKKCLAQRRIKKAEQIDLNALVLEDPRALAQKGLELAQQQNERARKSLILSANSLQNALTTGAQGARKALKQAGTAAGVPGVVIDADKIETKRLLNKRGTAETVIQHALKLGMAQRKLLKKNEVKLKALLSFSQIAVNLSSNFALEWPRNLAGVFDKIDVVNINFMPALQLGCIFPYDYCNTLFVQTMGPIFICTLLLLYNMFQTWWTARCHERFKSNDKLAVPNDLNGAFTDHEVGNLRAAFAAYDTDGGGTIDKTELTTVLKSFNYDEEEALSIFREANQNGDAVISFHEFLFIMDSERNKGKESNFGLVAERIMFRVNLQRSQVLFYVFLTITFLVLIGNSTILFRFFKCSNFDEAGFEGSEKGYSYLSVDLSLDCNGNRYKFFSGFVVIMVLVYPIGIPCMYWVLLWRHKSILQSAAAIKEEAKRDFPNIGHLMFLCEAYTPECYWFEVVECFRRLLLASAIGMISSDSLAAPTLGLLICMAFIYVFLSFQPFKSGDNNVLCVLLAYSTAFIFLGAILTKAGPAGAGESENEKAVFETLLLVVLVSGPALIVLKSIYDYLKPYFEKFHGPQKIIKEDDKPDETHETRGRFGIGSTKSKAAAPKSSDEIMQRESTAGAGNGAILSSEERSTKADQPEPPHEYFSFQKKPVIPTSDVALGKGRSLVNGLFNRPRKNSLDVSPV